MAHMKDRYFTPGPTELLPIARTEIERAIRENICSISHRSKQFEAIYAESVSSLRQLLTIPESYSVFFLGSATEAMERIIQNCASQRTYHFVNGAFSKRFHTIATAYGREADKKEVDLGLGFDFDKEEIPRGIELVCITHNETSTGVQLSPHEIARIKERYPEMLLAVDVVSSAPYVEIDVSKVDCLFFSVQKLFGMPAGLGVLIVSPAALIRSEQLASVGSYHSFKELRQYAIQHQTPETPNVLGIYLIGKVAAFFLQQGMQALRTETEKKAKLIYNFAEKSSYLKPFVAQPFRSQTVICLSCSEDANDVRARLKQEHFYVGSGYGKFKDNQIRIANFPAHSQADVADLIRRLGTST